MVVDIFIALDDAEYPLGKQARQAMFNTVGFPGIGETLCQPPDDTESVFELYQKEQSSVTGINRSIVFYDDFSLIKALKGQLRVATLCIHKGSFPFVTYFFGQ